MNKLREQFRKIPWASFGRTNNIASLIRSIVPVGNFPTPLPAPDLERRVVLGDPDYEQSLMDIQGTAFQVGSGKLMTCWHVCDALQISGGRAYIMSTYERSGVIEKSYWPIGSSFSFIDPRISRANHDVDVGILVCPAVGSEEKPYQVPPVTWGASADLGVGDRVLIGGYPLGTELFLALATNRGVVQPTFYDGIISAIIPATKNTETRILQISSIAVGGMSGGVVCDPDSGAVFGMVTSGLTDTTTQQALPMTYAIPSEVLAPYTEAISFKTKDGTMWR